MFPSTRDKPSVIRLTPLEFRIDRRTGRSSNAYVRCPVHHGEESLSHCVTCELCVGVRLEPHAGRSALACRTSSTELTWHRSSDVPGPPAASITTRVVDIMSPPDAEGRDGDALCLPQGESVARAAALMVLEGAERLGVVNSAGVRIGTVHARDVLYWLARDAGFVLGQRD